MKEKIRWDDIPTCYWNFLRNYIPIVYERNVCRRYRFGIPMKVGLICNDGANARNLSKNPKAMKAFWMQLKANYMQAQGKMLEEIPDEWFRLPSDEEMEHFVEIETGIGGLNKQLLVCDMMYCELLTTGSRPRLIHIA